MHIRFKMSIGKEQLRDLFSASQPEGSEIRDIVVRTRDGETDFEELVILLDIPVATPGIKIENDE